VPPTTTLWKQKIFKEKRVFKDEYDKLLNHKDFRLKAGDTEAVCLALWDDHDYGENNAARDYAEKKESKKAFLEFMEGINQREQIQSQIAVMKEQENRGVYYYYDHEQKVGDAETAEVVKLRVLMLDGRYDRDPDDPSGADEGADILGETQWNWLRQRMNERDDVDWYVVCNGSPVLNEGRDGKKKVGQTTRDKLFAILRESGGDLVDKTILLSGDLHYSVWHSAEDNRLFEFTSSSMTHSHFWWTARSKLRYMEIEEYSSAGEHDGNGATGKSPTFCKKNNFGILKVNKQSFHFCCKDAFGNSYLNVGHSKRLSALSGDEKAGTGPTEDA